MKTERLLSILLVLLRKERVTAAVLAARFEVSLRTIYRDLESLALAGIPIQTTPGTGGGVEIMDQFKVSASVFTDSELALLLTSLETLTSLHPNPKTKHLETKIRSLIPSHQVESVTTKSNQIVFDKTRWIKREEEPIYFQTVLEALDSRQILSVSYSDRYDVPSHRMVEPYQLIWKEHAWYVYGFCRLRNDFRLFRLDRMEECRMLSDSFLLQEVPDQEKDAATYLEQIGTKLTLRIHESLVEEILEYCKKEDLVRDGKNHYLVSFPFVENDYYTRILLGFGSGCEVIGPQSVRTALKDKLIAILRNYE